MSPQVSLMVGLIVYGVGMSAIVGTLMSTAQRRPLWWRRYVESWALPTFNAIKRALDRGAHLVARIARRR